MSNGPPDGPRSSHNTVSVTGNGGITRYYLDAWKHDTVFDARSASIAYWAFFGVNLFNGVIAVRRGSVDAGAGVLSMIYSLAVVIPSWAYAVRRLHDTGL